MKRIILAICIIVSAFSLSAQDTYEQAKKYYVNKEYDKAVPMFQRLAQGGDARAQNNLGVCYEEGQGVAQDYTQAVYWYRKSAEQGYASAQFNLGLCYYMGDGVAQDYTQAVFWYRKSAEQGIASAQYNLGYCYEEGQGVAQDYTQAVFWYRKSAEQGIAVAQYNLGYCYKKGQGVAQDYTQAVYWYRKAAEQGHAWAQFNLGLCYKKGQGVPQDYTQTAYWYRKAAEQGDADAQCNLGLCYDNGQGVAQDYTQAVYWYRKAAEQGHASAQYNLGLCYDNGQGVAQDYTQAVYWYRKSAEQGYAWAQFNLGVRYDKGQGVAQDYTQAVYWYRKSAEQGDADAQCNLGYCYDNGQGVAQDYTQAVYWYRKSAEQGYAVAQNNLGYCYKYGQGVSKDMVEAGRWYKLAADQGDADAKKQYMELYAQGYLSEKKDLASNSANTPTPKQEQTVAQKNETPAADRSIDTDIPVMGVKLDNTFAVIIGNENYQSVAKVPYAANDAKIFAEYCKRTLGLPEENVSVYTDATYGKMLGALQRISNIADAYNGNISIIFYYAGHGIPDDASREAFILPIDADGTIKESCLSLSRLYSSLARLNARRVTAFLDACFSGAERGNGMLASARGVAIKPKQNAIDGNVVVFTAVTGDQTAFPYKPSEHGLFTYYLLKKLKESRGNVSLGELSDYITTNVKQRSIVVNNKLQTPVVIPSDRLSTTWRTLPLR